MSDVNNKENKKYKWEFSDYAFLITGIIVAVILVLPDLLESLFDISFLGGSMSNYDGFDYNHSQWTIFDFRALSPLLFLLTTSIVYIQEAVHARKHGGYRGSLFTHTFESLLDDAIYMTTNMVMVYLSVFTDAMYISWLAGPITWILFMFIFPLVNKKRRDQNHDQPPWLLLAIFITGVIIEAFTGAWIAFPASWLIICLIKVIQSVPRIGNSIDRLFYALYYIFSVALLATGLLLNFWLISWAPFLLGIGICWIISKFGKFKRANDIDNAK